MEEKKFQLGVGVLNQQQDLSCLPGWLHLFSRLTLSPPKPLFLPRAQLWSPGMLLLKGPMTSVMAGLQSVQCFSEKVVTEEDKSLMDGALTDPQGKSRSRTEYAANSHNQCSGTASENG